MELSSSCFFFNKKNFFLKISSTSDVTDASTSSGLASAASSDQINAFGGRSTRNRLKQIVEVNSKPGNTPLHYANESMLK